MPDELFDFFKRQLPDYGDTEKISVEFKIELLPNDLKMLAFLAGELNNASHYFTTFANVNNDDCNSIYKSFSMDINSKSWHPFPFKDRVANSVEVQKKKKTNIKRQALTI